MKQFKFSRSGILKSLVSVACLFMLASCSDASDNNQEDISDTSLKPVELAGTAWFFENSRVDFPSDNGNLYLNFLSDGLSTTSWIRLSLKEETLYDAEIIWSENIREIGKKFEAEIGQDNSKTLTVKSSVLNFTKMESYKGVTAASFDTSKVPALQSEYLSNFDGTYTLDSTAYTLNIGAKINVHKDETHYWNANVLNAVYNEETKNYDFLLAHSSQKDAAGSIDPGITGSEPFISKQGLFWSYMTLTAKPGSLWEIAWSSEWKDTPYEALNSELDMKDSFTGPATSKIKYSYKFYFADPSKDESGWCTVERGNLIYETEFESDLPVNKTWKEIYDENEIETKITLPEEKLSDYWWYSTNAITSIEDSFVYKLTDDYKPSLESYEFYLALKEKPAAAAIYTNPGKFYNAAKGYLEITETTIQWNADVYTIIDGAQWSEAGKSTTEPKLPLQYCYLVSDGEKKYYCLVEYYVNNNFTYNHFRTPKETTDTICKTEAEKDYSFFDSYQKNLNKMDSSFVYWAETITSEGNKPCVITRAGDDVTVKAGDVSFKAVLKEKGTDTELSIPVGDDRMEMEVFEYLWLSDSAAPGKFSYPLNSFYELQLVNIEYFGWTMSLTKGTWEEDEEEYYSTYSIVGNYFVTEEQAQKILAHFE